MTRLGSLVGALLLLLAGSARAQEPASALDPERTSAVIVGVLRWQDPTVTAFPVADRKDRELRDTLLDLGVPAARTELVLDQAATAAAIRETVARVAKASGAGSTLVVYYAGHGSADFGGAACFLPYDFAGGRADETGLFPAQLAETIAASFAGERVLLFGDCCCSGGLAAAAASLESAGIAAASVTSATAAGDSTTDWTFTRTLIAALAGDPIADRDDDGTITLGELDGEVRDAMKFRAAQQSARAFRGVGPQFVLRKARARGSAPRPRTGPGPFAFREYVRVREGDEPRAGRIVGFAGGRYEIELTGYSDRRIVLRSHDAIEPIALTQLDVGARTGVTWRGLAYRATVVARDGDFHRITYDGWPARWDEWVLSDRFCPLPPTDNPPPLTDWGPGQATGPPNSLVPGDHRTAWASATEDGSDEWLELSYAQPVRPVAVLVYENFNPGALVRLLAVADDGTRTELWKGKDPTPPQDPIGISVVRLRVKAPVRRIRLELASKAVPGWNEIDAVGLLDSEGHVHWAVAARASSAYSEE